MIHEQQQLRKGCGRNFADRRFDDKLFQSINQSLFQAQGKKAASKHTKKYTVKFTKTKMHVSPTPVGRFADAFRTFRRLPVGETSVLHS